MSATIAPENKNAATKVITGMARLSYAHIWVPSSMSDNDPEKYSVSVLIPKSDARTVAAINKAVNAAIEAGISSKFGGKRPPKLKLPLRDGDAEKPDDPTYRGHYFVNATSRTRPGIVDVNRVPIEDPEQVDSGDYARVSVNFYAFNTRGNQGVACGLNNIMKLKTGTRLSGRTPAEDDFEDGFDMSAFMDGDDFMS
ncbi:MAG: DUF2815 family protein [Clostridiales bacterium]|jgi:hypothetical protein|nr:DUF2815 family protein [Clostridiales bacterium]